MLKEIESDIISSCDIFVFLVYAYKVWDREIILTALADYYDKDVTLLLQDIEKNYTNVSNII